MTLLRPVSTLVVLALVGCGEPEAAYRTSSDVAAASYAAPALEKSARGDEMQAAGSRARSARGSGIMAGMATRLAPDEAAATVGAAQPVPTAAPADPSAISRKIIYDAQVDLIVEDVDPIAKKVGMLVQDARGYIAEQNVTGSPGSLRSMRWRFRIPVEQFDSFVESIIALGELERNNRTQDVTILRHRGTDQEQEGGGADTQHGRSVRSSRTCSRSKSS